MFKKWKKNKWYNWFFRWAIWSTGLVPNPTKNIKLMLVKSHIKYIVWKQTSSFGLSLLDFVYRHHVFMKTLFEKQRIHTINKSFNFPWCFIVAAYKRNRKSKQTPNLQDSPACSRLYHSELDSTAVHQYSRLSDVIKVQNG